MAVKSSASRTAPTAALGALSGYLAKRDEHWWRRRFCVLARAFLYYLRTAALTAPWASSTSRARRPWRRQRRAHCYAGTHATEGGRFTSRRTRRANAAAWVSALVQGAAPMKDERDA